jgi:hypothetical protein
VHDAPGARIACHGTWLGLTRYEYRLLATLLERPGRVLSRAQLMDRVWHDAVDSLERTVDAHIKTLRAKLRAVREEVDHQEGDPIETHRPPLRRRGASHGHLLHQCTPERSPRFAAASPRRQRRIRTPNRAVDCIDILRAAAARPAPTRPNSGAMATPRKGSRPHRAACRRPAVHRAFGRRRGGADEPRGGRAARRTAQLKIGRVRNKLPYTHAWRLAE